MEKVSDCPHPNQKFTHAILECLTTLHFCFCSDAVQLLPLMSDPEFLPVLHRELFTNNSKPWECEGLQAITFLAWGLVLATIRSHHSQPTQGVKT